MNRYEKINKMQRKYDIVNLIKINPNKLKEEKLMINVNKNAQKIMKSIVEKQAKLSANSTTCIALYQPKAPAALKKFSKVENDK